MVVVFPVISSGCCKGRRGGFLQTAGTVTGTETGTTGVSTGTEVGGEVDVSKLENPVRQAVSVNEEEEAGGGGGGGRG